MVATAGNWEKFSEDWEELLPWGAIDANGERHFKMSEMTSPGGIERMQPFWRAIEEHIDAAVSFRFRISDLHNAMDDVLVGGWERPNFAESDWGNPYFFACRNLLNGAYIHAKNMPLVFPPNQPISFIFDERTDKKIVLDAWDFMRKETQLGDDGLIAADPRFENDRLFLPLQAADLWTWWVRRWTEKNLDLRNVPFPHRSEGFFLDSYDSFPSRKDIAEFFAGTVQEIVEKNGRNSMVFIRRSGRIVPFQ
ncbi:MAG: hypothetical protein R8G34_00240 [Paracoccaceae bacterium]|nr:hypothetical protein [Paracoccaceae bacterium]